MEAESCSGPRMWRIPRRCGLYGERHLSSSCGSRDSSVLSGRACPGASQARKTNLARGLGGCSVAAGRRDACRHHRLGATARGDRSQTRALAAGAARTDESAVATPHHRRPSAARPECNSIRLSSLRDRATCPSSASAPRQPAPRAPHSIMSIPNEALQKVSPPNADLHRHRPF